MADKTLILITGANQGLGYYATQQLAATGKYHVLMGSRDLSKAEKAIQSLASDSSMKVDGKDIEPLQIDVLDDSSIKAAVETVEKKFGRLDVLLNNAGVLLAQEAGANGSGPSLRELYRQHYEVNVFGAAVTTDSFLPLLRKGKGKRIAFTSSGLSSLTLACTPEGWPGVSNRHDIAFMASLTQLDVPDIPHDKGCSQYDACKLRQDPRNRRICR